MDNPWGSPWASDEPTSVAPPPTTSSSSSSSPLPTMASLPSLDGPSTADFTSSPADVNDGWDGSLNDGGWGGAEDLETEGWGAPSSAAPAAQTSSSEDEGDRTPETELDLEPSPVSSPALAAGLGGNHNDGENVATESPVALTPATTTPSRTASPPVEPSPFASPPGSPMRSPSPASASPSAFPASDSFEDFAPFSSPPKLASSTLVDAAEDDPWGATATFDDGDDEGAWGSSAPVRAEAGDDDAAVPWTAESEDRTHAAPAPFQSHEEDEWAEARRRAAIRAKRAPRELVDRLKEQWSELAVAQYPGAVPSQSGGDAEHPAQHEDGEAPVTAKGDDATKIEVDEHLGLRLEDIPNIANLLPTMLASPESTAIAYPSSATHAQFLSALRLSLRLSNSSSLLTARRARPILPGTPTSAGPQLGDEWWDRSRLGEEEERVDTAQDGEEKRGWFGAWSRRSSSQAIPIRSREVSADAGGSKSAVAAVAKPPSISASRPSTDRGPSPAPSVAQPGPSAQASPRPSFSVEATVPPVAEVAELSSTSGTSTPAPSVVSRFLGRFSRKPVAGSSTQSPKPSLELSAGDFDFLAEVEGSSSQAQDDGISHDQGDFLSGFGVPVVARGKQAELDDFLSSKPNVALPKPLAPPPAPPSRSSSLSSRPAPSKPVAPPSSSGLDDLSFLSFDTPSTPTPFSINAPVPAPLQASAGRSMLDDEWDSFVASPVRSNTPAAASPSLAAASVVMPALAPPLAPSLSASSRASTPSIPPILPTMPPPPSLPIFPPSPTVTPSIIPPASESFAEEDDFGDFDSGPSRPFPTAAVQPSSASDSHAFDDFDAFASAPASSATQSPARQPPASAASLSSPGGPAPEPVTKSPRHMQGLGGPSSRWSTSPSSPALTPGPTMSSASASQPQQQQQRSRTPGTASISNMASLVSHARNVSQTSQRGWSSPVVSAAPLPALLPPPPGSMVAAGRTQSFFDDKPPPPAATLRPLAPPVSPMPAPQQSQPAPLSTAPAPPVVKAAKTGGGLSAADLDFFDRL